MNSQVSGTAAGTRQRVLDAAERLFAARGFARTSVRDITEAAGANLGAVNYHFRSKDNLYAEVFARRAALFNEPVLAAAREAAGAARKNPDRAFRALGRAFLAPHVDRDTSLRLFRLFAREIVEPCLPRRLVERQLLVPAIGAITEIVRQVRPDLPDAAIQACAHAFFAQLMHIVKRTAVVPTPVDERLEQAVQFTVAGVVHLKNGAGGQSHAKTPRKTS
jgi:AcrR family transcriptional regulator